MTLLSHEAPINMLPAPDSGQLMQGYSEFIAASARLELAYRDLQGEIAVLNLRLQEQGQALRNSMSENDNNAALLRQLVEAMPCGVLLFGADGAMRLVNPEAARLLALSCAQLPDATPGSFDVDQLSRLLQAEATQAALGGTEHELRFFSSAGEHWISVRHVWMGGLAEAANSSVSSIAILEDITNRRLEERRREAEHNTTALAQVAALLAHEIRNPLASLELFAGLLAESPDRQQEWLSHLRAGIRSLSGTVNNVLTLHGEAPPTLERVELVYEVTNAIQFLQPLALQAGVRLVRDHLSSELWVRANRSALHQLVLNLVTNALRHTPQHGEVRVSAHQHTPSTVSLEVRDTGAGIDPQDLPRLFQSGFSSSGTRPGLGLAVCEHLMRHQGGAIHVQSQLGSGSTFTLEFRSA